MLQEALCCVTAAVTHTCRNMEGGSVYSVPRLLLNRLGCGGCMLSIIAVVQGGQLPAAIRANGQRGNDRGTKAESPGRVKALKEGNFPRIRKSLE
jgi:hypothetical protein